MKILDFNEAVRSDVCDFKYHTSDASSKLQELEQWQTLLV